MSVPDLSALIGSRICQDIISPLGAIGNGVELLALSQAAAPEEIELINRSVANANAKVQLFRLAFGTADPDQSVAAAEIATLLGAYFAESKTTCEVPQANPLTRPEAKAALLATLCLDSALPRGGTIRLTRSGTRWSVAATGALKPDPESWAALEGAAPAQAPTASTVHFALLPQALADLGPDARIIRAPEQLAIAF
jgi:histidine phosphotransferase ChpT